MRLFLFADSGSKPPFHLPWGYHKSIQSNLYDAIGETYPELSNELHQSSHAPPFTFSDFTQTAPFVHGKAGIAFNKGYWVITSDDHRILNAIANYAVRDQKFTAGHTVVPVSGTEIENISGYTETEYTTTSPVCVSRHRDGERDYLTIDDAMWGAELRNSVRRRMDALSEVPDSFEFSIESVSESNTTTRLVASDSYCPVTDFTATIRTDEKTSKFIQTHGLGERTGMGFGCIIPVSDQPSKQNGDN